jgi:hypothetical protein
MNDEHYAFVLGALARADKKLDSILEAVRAKREAVQEDEEFEEEFDI